jgi:hypothetical protein
MADLVNELAGKAGISPEQAKQGLGAILSTLKEQLPPESAAKLEKAVPNAEEMMAAAEKGPESSGGDVLAGAKGAIGKMMGGEGGGALLTKLSGLGLSADQLAKFVLTVVAFLKDKLPADALSKLSNLVPTRQAPGSSRQPLWKNQASGACQRLDFFIGGLTRPRSPGF